MIKRSKDFCPKFICLKFLAFNVSGQLRFQRAVFSKGTSERVLVNEIIHPSEQTGQEPERSIGR